MASDFINERGVLQQRRLLSLIDVWAIVLQLLASILILTNEISP